MRRKQCLKELTIKNNFMFGAVMMDEENCKGFLERVLSIIRSTKESVLTCMQKMKIRHAIMWRCR